MARVLIVEDEPDIQELLENFLTASGHSVRVAGDGVQALALFRQEPPDLVLLDIMLPKIDGYGVLEVLRAQSQVPVMMLTALDSEAHQIKGYDLQADDYVTKPFSMQVLLRKVDAVLRRSAADAKGAEPCLAHEALRVYPEAFRATVHGEAVELTAKEFELLVALLQNRGRVLTRDILLDRIWHNEYLVDSRVVDTHMKNLRKKLGIDCIQTVRGVGYRIDKAH